MFLTTQIFVGYGTLYDPNVTEKEYLNDYKRIEFMSGHLDNLMAAIRYIRTDQYFYIKGIK